MLQEYIKVFLYIVCDIVTGNRGDNEVVWHNHLPPVLTSVRFRLVQISDSPEIQTVWEWDTFKSVRNPKAWISDVYCNRDVRIQTSFLDPSPGGEVSCEGWWWCRRERSRQVKREAWPMHWFLQTWKWPRVLDGDGSGCAEFQLLPWLTPDIKNRHG